MQGIIQILLRCFLQLFHLAPVPPMSKDVLIFQPGRFFPPHGSLGFACWVVGKMKKNQMKWWFNGDLLVGDFNPFEKY